MKNISPELSEWIAARSTHHIPSTLTVDGQQIAKGHAVFLKDASTVLVYQESGSEPIRTPYQQADLKVSGRDDAIHVFSVHQCGTLPPHIHCELERP